MVMAAIAIKRYELRHGKAPPNLSSLCPEFLATVPLDLMDGQALRYRPGPDKRFTLYSVGDNAQDNGGDASPGGEVQGQRIDWRTGKDWVWPRGNL
jgi:hypothetical protein